MGSKAVAIEREISCLWQDILELSEIKPEDSFFDIGGNSLLMLDMLTRLGERLGADIDMGLLFEDSSLRGFAHLIEANLAGA
jgi:acyl carrier protein